VVDSVGPLGHKILSPIKYPVEFWHFFHHSQRKHKGLKEIITIQRVGEFFLLLEKAVLTTEQ